MHRLFLLATALFLIALPAHAQQQSSPDVRVEIRPPEPLSPSHSALSFQGNAAAADSLTEAELLHHLSRAYSLQSELLEAQAQGNREHAASLLDEALADLTVLLEQPGLIEQARFRALYRTLVTEYEDLYGLPPDSLTLQRGDIYRFRAEAFEALNDVREPLLEDVSFPDLPPTRTTVPMTRNRLVRSSIAFLQREPEKHLNRWLSRAETYFPMIEHVLAEENAPDELKYLAMIESGLNPQARSWARAVGMWQFMASTGRAYGLQINAWVDERRDPEKATRAAARHLKDLHERFDDWHLALAAYNAGAGRVNRALRRVRRQGKAPTFWNAYPYLPRETRNYVPMYIAASLVASNPSAFDIGEVPPGPRYAYDYVPVQGVLSLDDIAELAGTSTATIRALNPELRRSHTPPSDGAYFVRIPRGTYERFYEGYAALPDDKKRPVKQYVVRRGDSLGKIAQRHGVSVSALRQKNGIRGTIIHPGQRLIVPVPSYESHVALSDAEPVTVEYGQRVVRPITFHDPPSSAQRSSSTQERPTQERTPETTEERSNPPVRAASLSASAETEAAAAASKQDEDEDADAAETDTEDREVEVEEEEADAEEEPQRTVYTVRRGDTLGEIAQRHGVSTADLRRWNGIRGSRIRVGQQLTLHGVEAPKEPERVTHRVRRGDTLSEIASQYDVSVTDLRQWNSLRGSRIRAGQHLVIHRGPAGEAPIVYRVQRGDSLHDIARRYNTSVHQLKQWNSLNSNTIHPGQELKINT